MFLIHEQTLVMIQFYITKNAFAIFMKKFVDKKYGKKLVT